MERSIHLLIVYILPFVIIFFIILIKRKIKKSQTESIQKKIEEFKKTAIKIPVDLSKAQVNSVINNKKVVYNNDFREETLNFLLFNEKYYGNNEEEIIKTWRNEIKLEEIEYENHIIDFKFTIYMDKSKLKTYFVFQKDTFLYYHPESKSMYLDLEFMD